MIDAMFLIGVCSSQWYSKLSDIPVTGLPLFFAILACTWYTQSLPLSVYTYGFPNLLHIFELLIYVDLIQFCMHFAFHKKFFGLYVYNSHNIHHKVKHPTPKDAFLTGFVDSIIQLMLPIYLSIQFVEPNRTTITVFGILYSQWLLYIHSEFSEISQYLVSPEYHKKHHQNLDKNFAHVFPIWDHVLRTKC